jgi:hypothetical protein
MLPHLASPPIASLYSHCRISTLPQDTTEPPTGCHKGRCASSSVPRGMPPRDLEAAGGTPPRVLEAVAGAPSPSRPPGNTAALPWEPLMWEQGSSPVAPPTSRRWPLHSPRKERDAMREREEEEGGDERGPPPGATGVLHREPSSRCRRCRPSSGERRGRIGIGTKQPLIRRFVATGKEMRPWEG